MSKWEVSKNKWDSVELICALCIGLFIGFMIGGKVGIWAHRGVAIENNAAHWVCDPKTGDTTFVWGGKQ